MVNKCLTTLFILLLFVCCLSFIPVIYMHTETPSAVGEIPLVTYDIRGHVIKSMLYITYACRLCSFSYLFERKRESFLTFKKKKKLFWVFKRQPFVSQQVDKHEHGCFTIFLVNFTPMFLDFSLSSPLNSTFRLSNVS